MNSLVSMLPTLRRPLATNYTFKVFSGELLPQTRYYVVAQTSADKKDWDGMPNGIYFYPKDSHSKTECEQIVEELRADQEKIKQMKDPVIYREWFDYGVVTFGVMERKNL